MAKESQGIISYLSSTTAVATGATNVVGEVVGFNGPGLSAAVIDVTDLGSTAKRKLAGVYDGGQITLNVNALVTDAGQQIARVMMSERKKGNLMIQLSTAATTQKFSVKGYVTGLNFSGAVDNKLAGDLTFSIDNGVSFST